MNQYQISKLIPHAEPLILLECIEQHDDHSLQASLQIKADDIFATEQGVPSWIGLEYMGQAVAAFLGLKARVMGMPIKVGFLVSCRQYRPSLSFFPVGSKLLVSVNSFNFSENSLQVFECVIHCDGKPVVMSNLNIYVPDDVAGFMEG